MLTQMHTDERIIHTGTLMKQITQIDDTDKQKSKQVTYIDEKIAEKYGMLMKKSPKMMSHW